MDALSQYIELATYAWQTWWNRAHFKWSYSRGLLMRSERCYKSGSICCVLHSGGTPFILYMSRAQSPQTREIWVTRLGYDIYYTWVTWVREWYICGWDRYNSRILDATDGPLPVLNRTVSYVRRLYSIWIQRRSSSWNVVALGARAALANFENPFKAINELHNQSSILTLFRYLFMHVHQKKGMTSIFLLCHMGVKTPIPILVLLLPSFDMNLDESFRTIKHTIVDDKIHLWEPPKISFRTRVA